VLGVVLGKSDCALEGAQKPLVAIGFRNNTEVNNVASSYEAKFDEEKSPSHDGK